MTTAKKPKQSYFLQVVQRVPTLIATMSAAALRAATVALPNMMTTTTIPTRSYFLHVLQSYATMSAAALHTTKVTTMIATKMPKR